MKITFLGAARVVTGSNYLVETKNEKFLLDCGMFQGSSELEKLNYEDFKYDPKEIDFMLISHAHIDHSGRIPKLVRDGFKGKIYGTKASVDLLDVMLRDSAKIQENDAEWENRKRQRSGKEMIEPLYTIADVESSLKHFVPCHYDIAIKVSDYTTVRFKDAGHILGSAILEIWTKEDDKVIKLVFSGDLGMPNKPILNDPSYIEDADYLIVESTYGNSVHENFEDGIKNLIQVIEEVTLRGGSVIIPSFAVGRTQELIYELNKYYEKIGKGDFYKKIPIYIDSPMAVKATRVFMKNSYNFDKEAQDMVLSGDNIFEFSNLHYVKTVDESKMLNQVKFPRVVISSSGMATAGRVRHHLKHNLWDPKSAVVFVGYQAQGSLGRLLEDGIKQVKILGEEIAVKCDIYKMHGFSGHADEPMLLDWLSHFKKKPKKVFVVHGEEKESLPFAETIRNNLGFDAEVVSMGQEVELEAERILESEIKEEKISKEELKKQLVDFSIKLEALERNKDHYIKEKFDQERLEALNKTFKDLNEKIMDINMLLGK